MADSNTPLGNAAYFVDDLYTSGTRGPKIDDADVPGIPMTTVGETQELSRKCPQVDATTNLELCPT